jgi:hypothetical protein
MAYSMALREGIALAQRLAQWLAFEEFGNDEWRALVHAEFVNREDVGMIQLPGGASLLLEAAQTVRITGK